MKYYMAVTADRYELPMGRFWKRVMERLHGQLVLTSAAGRSGKEIRSNLFEWRMSNEKNLHSGKDYGIDT